MKNNFRNAEDIWFQHAYSKIPSLIRTLKVATDREIKVRLEGEAFPGPPRPFPWVTGLAIEALVRDKILEDHGYRGRRRIGKGVPTKFYALAGTSYAEIEPVIQQKRRVSADIINVLMGEAPASYHAEDLFLEALEFRLRFINHGRNKSEFRGKVVSGIEGKKPPDLDFIVERDGVIYGVDVKNWIRYEYKKLLLPPTMRSLARDANKILGYPILTTNSLPSSMIQKIEDIHRRFIATKG